MAQTTPIEIGYPEEADLKLRISVGACKLTLTRGDTHWVAGTYQDPSGKIPISVDQQGGVAHIRQRPDVESLIGILDGSPTLELALGTDRAFRLELEGGANEFALSLGGVPLQDLEIKHGAGKVRLVFDQPNPVEMDRLRIAMGAGSFEGAGLANANFAQFVTEGGAASFELGFDGSLSRSATVRATTGAASVAISIPAAMPARVRPRTTLGTLDVRGEFTIRDGIYWTRAAEAGESPALDFDVSVAVGLLRLDSTSG